MGIQIDIFLKNILKSLYF